jgi:hypothetical protein
MQQQTGRDVLKKRWTKSELAESQHLPSEIWSSFFPLSNERCHQHHTTAFFCHLIVLNYYPLGPYPTSAPRSHNPFLPFQVARRWVLSPSIIHDLMDKPHRVPVISPQQLVYLLACIDWADQHRLMLPQRRLR